jgi:AAA family ATP:ADP antiporter
VPETKSRSGATASEHPPGEILRVVLVSSYLLLVISCYVILKSVRDALYIDRYGAVKLPYVMIGIAVLVGLFVAGYLRIARHVRVPVLIAFTLLFLISNVIGFWILIRQQVPWIFPLLYIWAGCFGVIAPVQVWTLANEVFLLREIKRLVSFIGAAGIIGGITGGAIAGLLAPRLGTESLLLVAALLLTVCVLIVLALSPMRQAASDTTLAPAQRIGMRFAALQIARSRHLQLIAGLVVISGLCTTMVDFQFKAAADASGLGRDQLASFFGSVHSIMGLASLTVQLVLVRFTLRRFGLGVGILVLPLSLLVGTTALIAVTTLGIATFLKAADGSFKHSIDRSSKEMSYTPIAPEVRVQVKSAIDMALDRFGDGLGGVLLVILATAAGLGVRPLAIINFVLLAVWMLMAIRLRSSYIEELHGAITGGATSPLLAEQSLQEANARKALLHSLRSGSSTEKLAALDLAAMAPGEDLSDELQRLAKDESAEIRARVFSVLLEPGEESLPESMTSQLEEDDQQLMVRAFDLVLAEDEEAFHQRALDVIGDKDPETQGAMLALMVRRLGRDFDSVAEKIIDKLLAPGAPAVTRRAAATAVGLLPADSPLTAPLGPLLKDEDEGVRINAATSAGRLRRADLAADLIDLLVSRNSRRAAREALVRIGDDSVPATVAALLAEETPPKLRVHLSRIIGEIGFAGSAEELDRALDSGNREVRRRTIEAFAWSRRLHIERALPDEIISKIVPGLQREIVHCERLLRHWEAVASRRDDPALDFLATALREKLLDSTGCVFGWLELDCPPDLVSAVRQQLAIPARRDHGIELLDGLLPRAMKSRLIPLLERVPWNAQTRPRVREHFDLEGILTELSGGESDWLAACAVNVARRRELHELLGSVPEVEGNGTLRSLELSHALEQAGLEESETMNTPSLVDKVVTLKSIDMFRAVPAQELVYLARVVRQQKLAAGETLFVEGDPPGPMYVPTSGRLALQRAGRTFDEVPTGTPLGAWSLFDEQPRAVSAMALEPSELLVIGREEFYEVLAEHVDILRSLVGDLVRRLRVLAV